MARPIEFWFTMGSTYTYLTVMRPPELEEASGIPFGWRPFHLLTILQEMKHVPFADKPAKATYMWRDIERRAAMYGIPIRVPAHYPAKHSLRANQVALLGFAEGWGKDFVRAAYRRWLQLGQETGSEPNLSESLKEIGQKPDRILTLADQDNIAGMLDAETRAARAWNFRVRRRLRSKAKSSGATTVSRMPSAGGDSERCGASAAQTEA